MELPYVGVQAVLYCCITYWMVSCCTAVHSCTVQAFLVLPLALCSAVGQMATCTHNITRQSVTGRALAPCPVKSLSSPAVLQVYFYVDAGKFFWWAGQIQSWLQLSVLLSINAHKPTPPGLPAGTC